MFRKWNEWAPLPLRFVLGASYAAAGFLKLFTANGHENFIFELSHWGVSGALANVATWFVGALEFGSGLLLLVGALAGLVAIVQVLSTVGLLIAIFIGGLPPAYDGLGYFPYALPDVPYSFAIIAALLTVLFGGTGKFSLSQLGKAS
jgi:putative oxidoreductase